MKKLKISCIDVDYIKLSHRKLYKHFMLLCVIKKYIRLNIYKLIFYLLKYIYIKKKELGLT